LKPPFCCAGSTVDMETGVVVDETDDESSDKRMIKSLVLER
jgi:hypothetical protein